MQNLIYRLKSYKTLYSKPYIFNSSSGFTLIELLVVATLIGLIGIITTEIFVIGFTAQSKAEILKEVKQSGDYSVSVVESLVRNAVDISGAQCNSDANTLTIFNPDGYTTTLDCSGDNIALISGSLSPTPIPLTSNQVEISDCIFRIVCPTPPLSPKYVYMYFTISQKDTGVSLPPEKKASLNYQTTVSLRTY